MENRVEPSIMHARICYANFRRDVGKKPSWRHLLIRDDPTGPFGPDNARWQVARGYRRRQPTAQSR